MVSATNTMVIKNNEKPAGCAAHGFFFVLVCILQTITLSLLIFWQIGKLSGENQRMFINCSNNC